MLFAQATSHLLSECVQPVWKLGHEQDKHSWTSPEFAMFAILHDIRHMVVAASSAARMQRGFYTFDCSLLRFAEIQQCQVASLRWRAHALQRPRAWRVWQLLLGRCFQKRLSLANCRICDGPMGHFNHGTPETWKRLLNAQTCGSALGHAAFQGTSFSTVFLKLF